MTLEALRGELGRWSALGRQATLWWRDDDAGPDTPQLRRLLSCANANDVPLGLAVVPANLAAEAARVVAACTRCTVLQHGYAHRNHAPADEKRSELGAQRAPDEVADDLSRGWQLLDAAFGAAFVPVLVPPWNRIGGEVAAALPRLGYRGLSTFGPRRTPMPFAGLVQCNTHVDLIAWRDARSFVGEDRAAALLAAHLASRRESPADDDEPTGLLTHHLDFGDAAWQFLARLLALTREHEGAQWIAPATAFGLARPAPTFVRSA